MRRVVFTGKALLPPLLAAALLLSLCYAAALVGISAAAAHPPIIPRELRRLPDTAGILRAIFRGSTTSGVFSLPRRTNRTGTPPGGRGIRDGPICDKRSAEGGAVRGYAALCGDEAAVEAAERDEAEEERWKELAEDVGPGDGEGEGEGEGENPLPSVPSGHQQWQQQVQRRAQKHARTASLQFKQQQQGVQQWGAQGGKQQKPGEAPEWAKREQQRWERDQRPQTAEEIAMQEEHWRQQQGLVKTRLRQWQQQAKRMNQVTKAKEAVWAAEARSKWAAAAQGRERAEGTPGTAGVAGRFAVMTEDDMDDMMPGGTLSWQRLKATATAAHPNTPNNLKATIASVNPKGAVTPKGAAKPCSPRHSSPVIKVYSVSDIAKRTRYPPRQTVTLVLYRSLSLSRGLLFGTNFSCTIFRSRSLPSRHSISLSRSDEPVLRVHNASNVLFIGIALRSAVRNSSPFCEVLPEYGSLMGFEIICPALHIYRSFGIQFTQASVLGRIDVFRSGYTKLDSLFVTAPGTYERSPGVIRMGMCGLGMTLVSSKNVITNNDVFGAWELINLYRGSIGVKVHNNFLHDYLFAGFRCGADVHYSWDCMLTSVKNNFVFTPQSKGRLTFDSAGIYFCTHWFNPGSTVACNYVIGGDHCYYLDYCTSGVDITGGVCAQLWDGVKLNNGKRNKIRSLLMLWPWMKHVCRQTRIGTQSCNPAGHKALTSKQTGACSGLPTENDVELIAVDADTSRPDEYRYCGRVPAARKVNRQVLYRMALAASMPSTAALTMPPAYPAPSPIGYSPGSDTLSQLSAPRSTRTGQLVRVWWDKEEDGMVWMMPCWVCGDDTAGRGGVGGIEQPCHVAD
ncbi:unnamed protein product [Closterium sp. Naga37s-1]|nr:unnamed protein product [Closterium sp. Naga37s-1]